jgi:DNA-binding CsgD family transcriptional regulator/tetratricopeptide (TPR) repeat protein
MRRSLVGRESELGAFDALLGSLDAGDGAVVVVSGEPGIGKTALVDEVLVRGRSRGHRTLSARASEFERDLPFAAFADALADAVESLAPARRGSIDGGQLALLVNVFPSLGACLSGPPHKADPDERHLVLRALHGLLELLADERPFVLALDDLQWADPASIDLICRLLHRGVSGRALVLLASRPGQSEPRLNAVVADAERHGQAIRLELGPLGASDARKLLGDEIDPTLAESLYSESGGNPFYLEQLAIASRGQAAPGEVPEAILSWVSQRVSAAIRSELDDLSSSAKVLLQGAAVAGDPFEPALAAETAGLAERYALGDLDELLQRDLIRATDSPQRFCFRHPIVRRAVYEAAGAGWRIEAHRRTAAVLETRGAPAAARAHHIERSAQIGDAAGAAILVQAGQELMSRSPASAAHWFEIGLSLTPERDENLELRLGLIAQRAIALGLAGQIETGRDETRRFLALAPPNPGELRQLITVACVGFNTLLGNHADARSVLVDELARLPDQLGLQAAELRYELATTYFFEADWRALRHWASEALAADCQGMTRVGSLAVLALAEFNLANLDRAHRPVLEAAHMFDGLTDNEVAAHSGVAIFLAQAEIHTERLADAVQHIQRSIVISRASGQRLMTVGLLAVQAQALGIMGRVRELTVVAEAATETALLSSSDMLLSMAMGVRAFASVLDGDLRAALRFAERGSAALGPTSPVSWSGRLMLATALLNMGEPARCREQLTGPDGELKLPPIPFFEGIAYGLLVDAEIALGDLAMAEELTSRSLESAKRLGTNLPLALADRALAQVALERGDTRAALTAALRSCEAAERAGALVEAARSRALVGRAIAAGGDRLGAVAVLQAAHASLLSCGALRDSDQAARELRRLGRVVPRSGGARQGRRDVLGLTVREREVMERVTVGETNREIAEGLFLSPRTVDRHLARVFEKLDVHTRAAAASIFVRSRVL